MLLPLIGWASPVTTEHVRAELISERERVAPGTSVTLALALDIQPGWHTCWRNPGDSGEAPRILWALPPGVAVSQIRWPHPELIRVGPLANHGYSGRALHLVSLSVPPGWPAGTPIPVRAQAHWLVCAEHCVPESGALELRLTTAETAGPEDATSAAVIAEAEKELPRGPLRRARLGEHGTGLRLSIPLAENPALGLDPSASLWFFAGRWGLIEHAAEQPWRLGTDRLEIDPTRGAQAAMVEPEGVLVITGGDGTTTAFELSAERGLPPGRQSIPSRPRT
ncbi:protein-disulfide reductase DsbD domain-containing protein [Thiorhodococcus minor]|uniref:Thiol:disulfide interchange protein DsbD N-terminal domain-containing protein n=1 Tax=Thiorhodococcus minor TaxID=57489 RepID=A0A6M0JYV9_9GAMM|nr:protein-disulfide reductase DsbD domain-containing protein [Thiorhodococcus minor]NEV62642.1 hypothetical protein [Thiorhodococcus minor]